MSAENLTRRARADISFQGVEIGRASCRERV